MKLTCKECKSEYEVSEEDLLINFIVMHSEDTIDIQIACPECYQNTHFVFIKKSDLIENDITKIQ